MNIDDALKNIAAVHQQHSIKCYLAIQAMKKKFDWNNSDWIEIDKLVALEEPSFEGEILHNNNYNFDTVPRRRHWILSHGVYPHAYFTMLDWFETSTSNEIFEFYLAECLENKQYLSHNVSTLFAFEDAWDLIKTKSQKLRFVERFCEFVTATFYEKNQSEYKTSQPLLADIKVNPKCLLIDCLSNPGFWGHNLIALASICKRQNLLPKKTFDKLLSNLHEQCYWEFEDEMDRPIIQSLGQNNVTNETLEISCRNLLLNKKDNLHQITLAESIVFLFEQNWLEQSEKFKLIEVLEHYAKR